MSNQDNSKLNKLIRKVGGAIGKTQDTMKVLYNKQTMDKLMGGLQYDTHPCSDGSLTVS